MKVKYLIFVVYIFFLLSCPCFGITLLQVNNKNVKKGSYLYNSSGVCYGKILSFHRGGKVKVLVYAKDKSGKSYSYTKYINWSRIKKSYVKASSKDIERWNDITGTNIAKKNNANSSTSYRATGRTVNLAPANANSISPGTSLYMADGTHYADVVSVNGNQATVRVYVREGDGNIKTFTTELDRDTISKSFVNSPSGGINEPVRESYNPDSGKSDCCGEIACSSVFIITFLIGLIAMIVGKSKKGKQNIGYCPHCNNYLGGVPEGGYCPYCRGIINL